MAFPNTSFLLPVVLAVVAATTSLAQAPAIEGAARPPVYTTNEGSFRRMATTRTLPQYPVDAVARGVAGVVVVEATAGPDRHVEAVDVLQSPDDALSAATRAAVSTWTFPPVPTPSLLRAKLTFYFQIRNGKGVVLHPEQMPGNEDVFGGNQPARNLGAPPSAPPAAVRRANAAPEIDETEFTRLLADTNTVVLDVRDRDQFASGAHPRARNMPDDEVLTRARAELPANAVVVIDCSRTETAFCRIAHDSLQSRGFKSVAIYLP